MPSPPTVASQANPPSKTLVVGTAGHAHVKCIGWGELQSVNLKDFDAIIVNVAALDNKTLCGLRKYGYFDGVRTELAKFLGFNGTLIVITPAFKLVNQKDDFRNNWEWSPLSLSIPDENGDTIIFTQNLYQKYLSHLKKWDFYFHLESNCLSSEMIQEFGYPTEVNYHLQLSPYVVNRYSGTLAGEIDIVVQYQGGSPHKFGKLIILPYIPELAPIEATRLVLEDLLGKPQQSLPPKWVADIPMPFVNDIDSKIAQKKAEIETAQGSIAEYERKRAETTVWKKLVYASGKELEQIFQDAVTKLGAKTSPAGAEEEFVLEHKGLHGLVECKGVTKSISLDHLRQCDSHVLKFEQDTNREGKGILFGNAWRDLPLTDRGTNEKPIFPDNVMKRAAERNIALITPSAFLDIFRRFLMGEVSGEAILDAIMNQRGIVDFRQIGA